MKRTAFVFLALGAVALASGSPPRAGRSAAEAEITKIAHRVRADVARGKIDALLALVPPDGMGCGESKIPRTQVERDLRTKGSFPNALLFDSRALAEKYPEAGRTASFRDLFRTSAFVNVVVVFIEFPGQDPDGFPCASFHTDAGDDAPPGLCFFRRSGRWWLTDSLYDCE